MNASRLFCLTLVAAAVAATATGALAVHPGMTTRADISAQVLQARALGELVPADAAVWTFATPSSLAATLSRREVRDETLAERARGELIPAGQGMTLPRFTAETQTARADVRESVRAARVNGELIPAGEGIDAIEMQARAHKQRAEIVAATSRR